MKSKNIVALLIALFTLTHVTIIGIIGAFRLNKWDWDKTIELEYHDYITTFMGRSYHIFNNWICFLE